MNVYKRNLGLFGRFWFILRFFPKGIVHLVSVERTFLHHEFGRKFVELFLKIGLVVCYNGY